MLNANGASARMNGCCGLRRTDGHYALKEEYLRRIQIPLRREAMRRELDLYASWFFEHRPHQGLGGRTPKETYEGLPEQDVATRRRDTGQ